MASHKAGCIELQPPLCVCVGDKLLSPSSYFHLGLTVARARFGEGKNTERGRGSAWKIHNVVKSLNDINSYAHKLIHTQNVREYYEFFEP